MTLQNLGDTWKDTKVGAYVSQVLFVNHPPEQLGLRNSREIITLSTCLDLLLTGQLARLGDVLIQRLKAVESSVTEGWAVAKHYDLTNQNKNNQLMQDHGAPTSRSNYDDSCLQCCERERERERETHTQRERDMDPDPQHPKQIKIPFVGIYTARCCRICSGLQLLPVSMCTTNVP